MSKLQVVLKNAANDTVLILFIANLFVKKLKLSDNDSNMSWISWSFQYRLAAFLGSAQGRCWSAWRSISCFLHSFLQTRIARARIDIVKLRRMPERLLRRCILMSIGISWQLRGSLCTSRIFSLIKSRTRPSSGCRIRKEITLCEMWMIKMVNLKALAKIYFENAKLKRSKAIWKQC